MTDYLRNYFFWTAILVIGMLVTLGYKAMTADRTSSYEDDSGINCNYAAISVNHGEMTVQEYKDMGCD